MVLEDAPGQSDEALSLDELLRALSRIPYSQPEQQALMHDMEALRQRGILVGLVSHRVRDLPRPEAREYLDTMLRQGVAFMVVRDCPAEVVIVKTNAGRGWFGKHKSSFYVFLADFDPTDGYHRYSVRSSLRDAEADAMTLLQQCFRRWTHLE